MKKAEFPRENTFPYLSLAGPATNTSGTLGDSAEGTKAKVAEPEEYLDTARRGNIIKGSIGNTDYVDTNTTGHSVFAGNS